MKTHDHPRLTFSPEQSDRGAVWIVVACIAAIAAFRVARAVWMPDLPNFSPVSAVAFCGGLLLPGIAAWIVPFVALALSDVLLSAFMGYDAFGGAQAGVWLCVLAITALGRLLAARGRFGLPSFFGTLVGGSLLFYLVTNTLSWIANPAYPRSLSGLWMSLTIGVPGYPPTWTFLRNSLLSDVVFASLLLAVWLAAGAGATHRQKAAAC